MTRTRFAFGTLLLSLSASCVTTPTTTDFSATLVGNYQAIADCAFPEFRNEDFAWKKVDFPSQKRTEFLFGNDAVEAAKIEIIGTSATDTRVDSFMTQSALRPNYWEKRHRPIFERCATQTSK